MDGSHFDNLARLAAANASRRSILTSAFVAALAGLGAASPLGSDTAEAKNRKRRRKRRRRKRKKPQNHNVCTLDCTGASGPQPCGPAGSGCQCVNRGDGAGACVKPLQGASCLDAACPAGEVCGIPCTNYLPFCWAPCV